MSNWIADHVGTIEERIVRVACKWAEVRPIALAH